MGFRYGIVGYNGSRKNKRVKPPVKKAEVFDEAFEIVECEDPVVDTAVIMEEVVEADFFGFPQLVIPDPLVTSKRKEFIVFLLKRIKDLKDSEVKEKKVAKKKRKYRKRQKSSI